MEPNTLVSAIVSFLAGDDLLALDEIRLALEREVDDAGPEALVELKERLAIAVDDWVYHPPVALARRIHHLLADRLLESDSRVEGLEHLQSAAGRPLVIVANHLSYADANILEILLSRYNAESIAARLTAMAGPKVFTSRQRKFSSLCFGTIRTPQNAAVSSEEAALPAREVARAARRSIELAHERLGSGDTLLVFGEGTRSRNGQMQPMLPGVARYLEHDGLLMLPVGIVGTEALFPIADERIHPGRVDVRIGPAISGTALNDCAGRDRRRMMDVVGLSVASLLPAKYQGVYGTGNGDLARARELLNSLRRQ